MFPTTETVKCEYILELENFVDASLDRIRSHPFIAAGFDRRLSQQQIVRWLMCAGRESRSFPHVIENMMERTDSPKIVHILEQNLQDENGHGKLEHAHFTHYLDLLKEIGLSNSNFEEYNEKAGIQLTLSLAFNISTQKSQGISLGYMLVNEGMTSITYASMRSAFSVYFPAIQTPFF
ncbi:MAG: iron-containing redox enzyme family protein [Coleofasciculaceae cyanobacterium RL_1_1]|nr:iron-containing redox enzyme family protein [Coleofasciculaceae cyanobacterium RL_1_1]